jgi:hypothetical protein
MCTGTLFKKQMLQTVIMTVQLFACLTLYKIFNRNVYIEISLFKFLTLKENLAYVMLMSVLAWLSLLYSLSNLAFGSYFVLAPILSQTGT